MSPNDPNKPLEVAPEHADDAKAMQLILESMASPDDEGEWTLARLASALFPAGIGSFEQLTWPEGTRSRDPVTAANTAEDQLRTAELRYRTLIEQIPAVTFMAVLGEGENEIYVSPHIETLLGFSQQEWLENPFLWYTQLHPDDRDIWHQEFARGCRTGGPFRAECRFLARDGRVVWVRGEARLVKDAVGRPLFLQGVAFDISESKRAEALLLREAIRTTEERYRDLVEHLGAIFWEADAATSRFTFVSRGAEKILGYPAERWLDDPAFWLTRVHPDDRAAQAANWDAVRSGVGKVETEFRTITADNRTVWLHQKIHVASDQRGGQRMLGMIFDVSDRKRAEEILLINEARLRAEADIRRTLHRIGSVLASELDVEKVVQLATDEATTLTTAKFGAFSYNVTNQQGEVRTLWTLSGREPQAFEKFLVAQDAQIFGRTFGGERVVRIADGPPPVRSYLAVPVVSRTGSVIGGMFFGHPDADRFTEEHERLAAGIAGWTAVALDNARLFNAAEKARAEAQAANREKDEFLATMSHELRTPLNAILGWAAIMRSGALDEPTRRAGLEIIERNARAQSRIIEDLLDISRIVSGKLLLESAPVELRGVIESALGSIRLAAEAKQIDIRVGIDSTAIVTGDAARLHQVVGNLLTNAIKFTPRGGWVDVRLTHDGGTARISVEDNGEGISAPFLPYVFERFRQADQTSTRAHGGLGLGLSIVRHIVHLHGGEVHATSPGPGRGATFTIELPIVTQPAVDGAAAAQRRADALLAHTLDGVRLLVVEDDADARDLLVHLLEHAGASVTAAESGPDALAMLDTLQPDLLISDIGMPDQDGYELIRQIRSRGGASASMPALAVTAYAGPRDQAAALSAGFNGHLGKPVIFEELVDAIRHALSRT